MTKMARIDLPPETKAESLTWEGPVAARSTRNRLVSLIAAAPQLDLMQFLNGAYGRERFYWSEPAGNDGDELVIAGMGIAAQLFVPPVLDEDVPAGPAGYRFDEIERQARALFDGALVRNVGDDHPIRDGSRLETHPARPRLFGGFAFQDDFIPDNTWTMFSPALFILPHYQLVCAGGRTYMTINALVGEDDDLAESLAGIQEALLIQVDAPPLGHVRALGRPALRYPMSPEMWRTIINSATRAIHDGRLEKVVLSRVCELRFDEAIDGTAALDYLNDSYGDCFRFLFEPCPHHAFFGATPELLVRKEGARATTMALAGSIARGQSTAEDATLAEQLLASAKNRHEHQLVIDTILASLEGAVDELEVADEPVVWPLRNIQHLLTPISGRATGAAISTLALARRLHPTPAMGGVPTGEAMAFLSQLEPVPRGWYAAPIGWIDGRGDGVFAVAIRSAVTQHNRAWLYAGAGIVGDSQPAHEWAETALKFRPMLGALRVEELKASTDFTDGTDLSRNDEGTR